MCSTFSAASEDSASVLSEPECVPLPSARLIHSAELSSQSTGPASLVTKMCARSPQADWLETESASMSSAEDFHAKTSVLRARGQGLQASGRDCGVTTRASLAKYDRTTSSWRTSQRCFLEGLEKFSETWPRSGMTRNGIAYELPALDCHTAEIESGLWPTPRTSDSDTPSMPRVEQIRQGRSWHAYQLREAMLSIRSDLQRKYAPPSLYERAMGFPAGWTECLPSETRSFRRSRK